MTIIELIDDLKTRSLERVYICEHAGTPGACGGPALVTMTMRERKALLAEIDRLRAEVATLRNPSGEHMTPSGKPIDGYPKQQA